MITTLSTIASVLLPILISYGITAIQDLYNASKTKEKKITADDITKAVKSDIESLKSKNAKLVDKVLDRLSSVQSPLVQSGALKDYITQTRNKYKKLYETAKNDLSDIETKLGTEEERANNFNYLTDYQKANIYDDIPSDIQSNVNKLKQDSMDVEKKITEGLK